MPEGITAENLLNNIMESLSDGASKQKSVTFFEGEKSNSVTSQFNRLFGRQKPVHHLFGGGKTADVLLWRNKKISGSVLSGATAIWVLFEWLNYHFLSLVCLGLAICIFGQFVWSIVLKRNQSEIPHLVIPEELFANIAVSVGAEVNRALGFIQDAACRGNFKQFLAVVGSLLAAAVIGTWCNFLTVLYIGFVAAHTLPVLYEKNEDQVDSFIYSILEQLQQRYRNLNAGVLSRVPSGKRNQKKYE